MTVKVNYDTKTTLALGYYPNSIVYASIPKPYIEISDEEHSDVCGKTMCVIDEVFQEYTPSFAQQLEEAKSVRIATRLQYLVNTDWQASAFVKYQRPIDSGVSAKCALANSDIQNIKACTTLEEVEQYPIEF
jgi:hypothetical protein